MEENIKDKNENPLGSEDTEKQIDVLAIVYKLWSNKKVILIWCMWGILAGLIIAFSIPREYTTNVKLAPEIKSRTATNLSGGLSALASMAGISSLGNSGTDAFYPQLYPDIVNSIPFLMSLVDVPVTDKENNHFTVEEYITENTHGPWWGVIIGAPFKLIGYVRGGNKDNDNEGNDSIMVHNTFKLSTKDDRLVGMLRKRINANVDQKTNVISISVEMQDPMVSAILADTVVSRLREYVTNYRTDKARKDLEYAQKLNNEAQQEYYDRQQRLADYIDRNQKLATQSAKIAQERLENEVSLAFNLYNETALQVQNAKSKVQETTPVYTELTPATVPLRPTSPRKGLILGGCTFLAFVASCCWILFGNPIKEEYKNKVKQLKESDDKKTEGE